MLPLLFYIQVFRNGDNFTYSMAYIECRYSVMAQAQKTFLIFWWNREFHVGCQRVTFQWANGRQCVCVCVCVYVLACSICTVPEKLFTHSCGGCWLITPFLRFPFTFLRAELCHHIVIGLYPPEIFSCLQINNPEKSQKNSVNGWKNLSRN
jgi:hypothetical protein